MQVTTNAVVSIHYKLTNSSGEVLDSSEGREPLAYLHGRGNIIPGLEKELEGKETGSKLSVTVPPEEAYGIHDESLIRQVSRDAFKGIDDLQAGMQFQSQSEKGIEVFTVTKIDGDQITIDGNHSLAGMTLSFDVEIMEIRAATEEEITHGHVHGPGDPHH
jgi:FKBP-type peptidyl-prolyl cis-trans isomerase SlyD